MIQGIKRLTLALAAATLASAVPASDLHPFADNSVLSTGKWVRIGVSSSGIYKITYENLKQWGISDPSHPRVYGYGGAKLPESFSKAKTDDLPQLYVWMEKGADGVFNSGDYILFYAQGPNSWEYNGSAFTHTLNPYSDYGYYFVTSDAGTDKLINDNVQSNAAGDAEMTVNSFTDYSVFEEETTNLINSGQRWFGEIFSNAYVHEFDFSFPGIRTDSLMTVTASIASSATSATSFTATLGSQSKQLPITANGSVNQASDNLVSTTFTPTGEYPTIGLKFNGSSYGSAWLDYIEVNAYRNLVMNGSYMQFREPQATGKSAVKFQLTGGAGLTIWNMTDQSQIKRIDAAYTGGVYTFTADETDLHEYIAVNPSANFPTPTFVEEAGNQNLHSIKNADLVIISPDEYLPYANRLADLHANNDGISTLVVTPQQVYNEYSSGTPDATSFRWLMKSIYDRAPLGKKPQNLLLFGDATYDHRGYVTSNVPYNKVLTYESVNSLHLTTGSYASDDYFGMLSDNSGSSIVYDTMNVCVGRIPVSSESQANAMVDKVQTYMRDSLKSEWKNRLVFIADDDNDANLCYTWQSDTLALRMERNHKELQVTRLFTDAYTKSISSNSVSYPAVHDKVMQLFSDGTLYFNYVGHGSTEGLAAEKFFDRDDISDLYNRKYPFFFTATCDYSDFDKSTVSSGEELVLREKGGAIAMLTACRTVYADGNFVLNENYQNVYLTKEDGQVITFGEANRRAKNKTKTGFAASNRMPYILLGDPALRFPLPTRTVTADSVNVMKTQADGTSTYKYPIYINDSLRNKFALDTVKALSTVRIKGRVLTEDGTQTDTTFSGTVHVIVQDKLKSITTLGNASGGETKYTYKDRVNTLFKGKALVKNGEYELLFLVPKDIAYDYGTGRINLYAKNDEETTEANGYTNSVIIGGTSEDVEFEENSPIINMYINTPYFKSGGTIDASSILYATLQDENGINTTGSGIGHDLQLMIEGDTSLVIPLNDYYENDLGTYKSGNLKYTLPELNAGSYTVTLRAWDLMNNSASASMSFKLKVEKQTGVYKMYAYPNPVDRNGVVTFVVEHDQPETEVSFKTEIYDTSGNRLYRDSREFYNDDSRAEISVNAGGLLRPGVYVYRMWTETHDNSKNVKTNKLIVK